MPSQQVDYIVLLNNYLQQTRENHLLVWEYYVHGPQHQAMHTARAKIGNTIVGEGTAPTRTQAKQVASYHLLRSRGMRV
ncbi:hypothetical protein OF83DRAFT_1167101 [Amylostereum chailletii]|nr:hypothetical protein OF83DRAFT_1167101 [Amylostereum chailletii]